MSGFAWVVAICVTHPEWPFRIPLGLNCSVIVFTCKDAEGLPVIKEQVSEKRICFTYTVITHVEMKYFRLSRHGE